MYLQCQESSPNLKRKNMRNDRGRKKHLCKWCGILKEPFKLKLHSPVCKFNINVPHKLKSPEVDISIKCPTCEEVFQHLYYYKQHFDGQSCGHFDPHHNGHITLFKCTKCGNCFPRKDYATSHYTACNTKMDVDENELYDDEEEILPPKVRIQQLNDEYTQKAQEQAHLLRKIIEVEAELKMFRIADSANDRIDGSESDVIENLVDNQEKDGDGGVELSKSVNNSNNTATGIQTATRNLF